MKLRRSNDASYWFFCPGCEKLHKFGPSWEFNGDMEKPTFKPSLLCFIPEHVDDGEKFPRETLCHLFLTDGKLRFLNDCPHKLKGQTVDLPDFPERREIR